MNLRPRLSQMQLEDNVTEIDILIFSSFVFTKVAEKYVRLVSMIKSYANTWQM